MSIVEVVRIFVKVVEDLVSVSFFVGALLFLLDYSNYHNPSSVVRWIHAQRFAQCRLS